MPWCHSCSSEFREGIANCPTCNVALDALPPQAPEEIDDDQLIESGEELSVLRKGDFAAVMELRTLLHRASIPCAVLHEELDPETATPQQLHHPRFELLIQTSRADDAQRTLEASGREMLEKEGLAPMETDDTGHCPACGAAILETAQECPDCGLSIGE